MAVYHVDLDSLTKSFPRDLEVPWLLQDFATWLKTIPHGTLGYFDGLMGEPMPAGLAKHPSHVEHLRSRLGVFLSLPDGSLLALWNYHALEPAVVLLGSEGETENIAPSLRAFLDALAAAKTGVYDLDDADASESRELLRAWLVNKPMPPTAKVPEFRSWFESDHLGQL